MLVKHVKPNLHERLRFHVSHYFMFVVDSPATVSAAQPLLGHSAFGLDIKVG